jgi:hypothetical protein
MGDEVVNAFKEQSLYVGGAFRAVGNSDGSDVYSLTELEFDGRLGKWTSVDAPKFSSGWVLSAAANNHTVTKPLPLSFLSIQFSLQILLAGAINGLIHTPTSISDTFLTGLVHCSRNTSTEQWSCSPINEDKDGPMGSHTTSVLLLEEDCVVLASPTLPRQVVLKS